MSLVKIIEQRILVVRSMLTLREGIDAVGHGVGTSFHNFVIGGPGRGSVPPRTVGAGADARQMRGLSYRCAIHPAPGGGQGPAGTLTAKPRLERASPGGRASHGRPSRLGAPWRSTPLPHHPPGTEPAFGHTENERPRLTGARAFGYPPQSGRRRQFCYWMNRCPMVHPPACGAVMAVIGTRAFKVRVTPILVSPRIRCNVIRVRK
jgi:hypothetical protein